MRSDVTPSNILCSSAGCAVDCGYPPHAAPDHEPPAPSSQFALLTQRRFGPFFWTQFLGAFNDNLFKTALLVVLTYDALSLDQRCRRRCSTT